MNNIITDSRLAQYAYYIVGGETPVRVLLDHNKIPYGAEKPGSMKGEWVKVPTMLSKIEQNTEGDVRPVGEKEFNLAVQGFSPKTVSAQIGK